MRITVKTTNLFIHELLKQQTRKHFQKNFTKSQHEQAMIKNRENSKIIFLPTYICTYAGKQAA